MKIKSLNTILFFGFCLLESFLSFSVVVGDDSRSCLNDVDGGSCLWGTRDERTTYIGSYFAGMAPKIDRLSVSDLSKSSGNEGTIDESKLNLGGSGSGSGSDWSKLNEVGTIWGTDGKLYRYTFALGVEPRRVVENGVERVVWEQVLIRVLRPVKKEEQADVQNVATTNVVPCAPVQTARPCAPASTTTTPPNANVASGSIDSDGILTLSVVTQERNSPAAKKGKPTLVLPIEAKKAKAQNTRQNQRSVK